MGPALPPSLSGTVERVTFSDGPSYIVILLYVTILNILYMHYTFMVTTNDNAAESIYSWMSQLHSE